MAKLEQAYASVSAEHAKQTAINEKIREEYNNIDPMELAQRMQAKMMEDPERAQQYMQLIQSLGASMQTEVPATSQKETQMQAESKDAIQRYRAAQQKAYGPANARWKVLTQKLGAPESAGGIDDPSTPDWAYAEQAAIRSEWDKADAAICPQWWGAGGEVHAFMKRYKDWLVQERVPLWEKHDAQTAANYEMVSTPAASYRSLAAMEAAQDYIKLAQQLFGHREWEPRCPNKGC
jgi:hypothetical protein